MLLSSPASPASLPDLCSFPGIWFFSAWPRLDRYGKRKAIFDSIFFCFLKLANIGKPTESQSINMKNATICAVLTLWVNSPQHQPGWLWHQWMPRPICGGSAGQWCGQTCQRLNTPGSAWGTPWGSVGPKSDALGSHPLGGGSPSQATPFFFDKHTHSKKLTEVLRLHPHNNQ